MSKQSSLACLRIIYRRKIKLNSELDEFKIKTLL